MTWRSQGAEAVVTAEEFFGIPAVRKVRPVKTYRVPELDHQLREERLRNEVRLLRDARRAGVRTPVVLDIDRRSMTIVLERLEGRTLTEVLEGSAPEAAERHLAVEKWGEALGRLHAVPLSHGDLTASNVLWDGRAIALLDLSLGNRSPDLEDLGVDLHLVKEDLDTLCSDRDVLRELFLRGYRRTNPQGAEAVIGRAEEIQGRVRYM